ncbi:MAG: GntR family transcriptional regulator [Suipraeoptans sp.]
MKEETNLYTKVKRYIAKNIYDGVYEEGMKIPSERALSEELGVSRVTIRKSLQELEKDSLLIREVGVGTKIRFKNTGHAEVPEIINLVAPARNPFFSEFIDELQMVLDKEDVLLSYVQKSKGESIEDCLFRLYQRGLHNAIIWLQDMRIDIEKIKILRALGMNMTFFDADINAPYADCIHLDNYLAIKELVKCLENKKAEQLVYMGWDNENVYSVRERRLAFEKYAQHKKKKICTLPWSERKQPTNKVNEIIDEIIKFDSQECISIICGDGEISILVGKILREYNVSKHNIMSIDEFTDSNEYDITTIDQNFDETANRVWDTIKKQCESPKSWKAKSIQIKGNIINR